MKKKQPNTNGHNGDSSIVLPNATLLAEVEAWTIPLGTIYEDEDVRLDATHYDRKVAAALKRLKESPYPLRPLSAFAEVRLPGQFARIWAKNADYGLPYVNASELMSLAAFGMLGQESRYLSRVTDVDIGALVIHEGWLGLSCSGTIGRVYYIPKRLDGWVATHDLIRIIPLKADTTGFLYSYLFSPLAQAQIQGYTYGGQIDHVTDEQVRTILVPDLPSTEMSKIHNQTMDALQSQEKSIQALEDVSVILNGLMKR